MEHVVKVEKNLNMETSRELKRELTDILNRGLKQVALDFSATESVDSSGLGKLLLFNEKFKDSGGNFRISNVTNPEVAQLFRLINLEKFITIDFAS